MPLLLKKCLGKKYRQEADYEIFTGKPSGKRAFVQKSREYVSAKKEMHKKYFQKITEKGIVT